MLARITVLPGWPELHGRTRFVSCLHLQRRLVVRRPDFASVIIRQEATIIINFAGC